MKDKAIRPLTYQLLGCTSNSRRRLVRPILFSCKPSSYSLLFVFLLTLLIDDFERLSRQHGHCWGLYLSMHLICDAGRLWAVLFLISCDLFCKDEMMMFFYS